MRNKLFVLIVATFLFSCVEKGDIDAADIIACGNFNPETHICDKRDGKKYKITKKIDGQIWLAENLKYKPPETSSLCYKWEDKNCEEYGRLYPFEEIDELCPEGWKVPNMEEWKKLEERTGGSNSSDNNIKASSKWLPYTKQGTQVHGYGENTYNFSALPAGVYKIVEDYDCEDFDEFEEPPYVEWGGLGTIALFMSSSVNEYWAVTNDPEMKFCTATNSYVSVRCIKKE